MLSPDRRTVLQLAVTALGSAALSGCFRPLYGTSGTGDNIAGVLASIEVEPLDLPGDDEYLGHVVRTELISLLTAHGAYAGEPKRYKLRLTY
ncbi:MAG: hypothetical protein LBR29_09705, partial [Methylobacteriaceae bacterium]|nr:hypothetical protein [Methylobacteriaceae bacterium]